MIHNRIPQLGPAVALAQLLQEHPHLHPITWRITPEGQLCGSLVNDGLDMHQLMAPYAAALGVTPSEFSYTSKTTGQQRYSSTIFGTWRDVEFSIQFACLASSVAPAVEQVAA